MSTQINHKTTLGRWSCVWSPVWLAEGGQTDQAIHELLEQMVDFPVTLKDDKRSLVKRGHLWGVEVVAKNPRDKNRRKWSRCLSLFRQSEVLKTLNTLTEFREKSVQSVKPICVLEKRVGGMVVDSWLIYEYKAGQVSGIQQLSDIVSLLKSLHRYGYRHDDPNFGNFLLDDKQRVFLIDCKGKSRVGTFSDYYDYVLLSERNEGVDLSVVLEMAGLDERSIGYQLAKVYAWYKEKRSQWKKRIRS